MTVMLCIDDKGGMMFNHRRQSRDQVLQEHILNLIGDARLWVSRYSRKLFPNDGQAEIYTDEDFLEKAQKGDFCFAEDKDISLYEEKIERLIIFRWNRVYPADTFLELDLNRYTLEKTENFEGNSHEKITKEIYTK